MEEMIDFLLGNLVFIIAIIWIVANLFRRRDKNEEETNRPQRTNQPTNPPRGRMETGGQNLPENRSEQGRMAPSEPRREPMNPRPVSQSQTASRKPTPLPWERTPLPWETVPDEFESGDSQGGQQKGTAGQDIVRQTVGQERDPYGVPGEAREAYESLSARQRELQEEITALDRGSVNDLIMRSPSRSARPRLSSADVFQFENLDQKTVVQGFVWSEIFADPRAKRKARGYVPYQRRRRHG